MNDFESTINNMCIDSEKLQKKELELKQETQLFQEKFFGFLKENGLPENFTLPQLVGLAIRKSKNQIIKP